MNIQEMHIAVEQQIQKINSNVLDNILPEEMDLELNRQILRFIKQRLSKKSNRKQEGVEESTKRLMDLQTIIETMYMLPEVPVEDHVAVYSLGKRVSLPVATVVIETMTSLRVTVNEPHGLLPGDPIYIQLDGESYPTRFFVSGVPSLSEFLIAVPPIAAGNPGDPIPNTQAFKLKVNLLFPLDFYVDLYLLNKPLLTDFQGIYATWDYVSKTKPVVFKGVASRDNYSQFNLTSAGEFILVDESDVVYTNLDPLKQFTPMDISDAFVLNKDGELERVPIAKGNKIDKNVPVRITEHEFESEFNRNPFAKSHRRTPSGILHGDKLHVRFNERFLLKGMTMSYIRNPAKVDLSSGIDCDLPEQTHEEIVSMAAQSFLEAFESPRYKTNTVENTLNE